MANLLRICYYLAGALKRPYWNTAKLQEFQEKRLRAVINYAYRSVPFYHEKYKKAGISPSDIQTLDDLAKLPTVKKDELRRENARRLVSLEFDVSKLRADRTSGSTGQPFTTYLTKAEDDWRKAIYMRANISCGQRPRDHWVFINAPHHFAETTNTQRKLGIFAQNCISVFLSIDEQIRLVIDADADVLDGYSGSLILLAKEVTRKSLTSIKPRIMFGSAELIDATSRRFIEDVFDAPYYDQFGCAEIDRSAWECVEKSGYHMDVDSVITQFVDDEECEVSAGEKGEIVYTSLFNYAMPFIRYAVGDVGLSSDEKCPCGRNLSMMKVVEGRKDSFLRLPDGQLLSPMAFRLAVGRFFERIIQYRVVQKKADLFEIYIQKRDDGLDKEVLRKELTEHVRKILGLDAYGATLAVEFVDEIPFDKTGKLRAVVCELA